MLLGAGGIVSLLIVALWLFALFDVISTDAKRCRNLPKLVWLLVVVLLPDIGSVAWLLLGRPRTPAEINGSRPRPRRPLVALEDSDRWTGPSAGSVEPRPRLSPERLAEIDAELDRRIDARGPDDED